MCEALVFGRFVHFVAGPEPGNEYAPGNIPFFARVFLSESEFSVGPRKRAEEGACLTLNL